MRPTRRRRLRLWFRYLPTQLRITLFGPRPLALVDRLALVALLVLAVYLFGNSWHSTQRTQHIADSRAAASSARACASYAADEVAFDKTLTILDRFGISDPDYRGSILQSRDQKRMLRSELDCPPYPPPPAVAIVPGEHPRS